MFSFLFYGAASFKAEINSKKYDGETIDAIVSANNIKHEEVEDIKITDGLFTFEEFDIHLYSNLKSIEIHENSFVGSIPENSFSNLQHFKSIIANGATEVGKNAFANISTLETAFLDSVKKIGEYAFQNCISLNQMSLPNLVSLNEGSFSGCQNLEKIDFPKCQEVSNFTFSGCHIEEIKLPSCTFLGEKSFGDNNQYIKILYLPEITTLNTRQNFFDVPNLTELYLPKLVFHYGYKYTGFKNLMFLKYLNLDSIEFIDEIVGNPSLENVSMKSATLISQKCFEYSYKLKYVYLPNLRLVSYLAFQYCTSLQDIELPKCVSLATEAFYHASVKSINAPLVSVIDENAFSYCEIENGLYIPSFKWMHFKVFTNCLMTTIELPSLEYVCEKGFYLCPNLKSVKLPIVRFIDSQAFRGCSNLESIDIPECQRISDLVFLGTKLRHINFPALYYAESFLKSSESIISVNLPNLEYLFQEAFYSCVNLVYVNIPKCRYIYPSAFANCISLQVLDLHSVDTLKTGDFHFYNCTNLVFVNLSSLHNVNITDANIFGNCLKLKMIAFGDYPPETLNDSISFSEIMIKLPSQDSWENYASQSTIVKKKYIWHGFNTNYEHKTESFASSFWGICVITIAVIILIIIISTIVFYTCVKKKIESNTTQTPLI